MWPLAAILLVGCAEDYEHIPRAEFCDLMEAEALANPGDTYGPKGKTWPQMAWYCGEEKTYGSDGSSDYPEACSTPSDIRLFTYGNYEDASDRLGCYFPKEEQHDPDPADVTTFECPGYPNSDEIGAVNLFDCWVRVE